MPRPPTIARELGSARAPGVGFVGTSVYRVDEPPDLTWPMAAYVIDKMARTDAQLAAIERAVSLPIVSARWPLDPGAAREEVVRMVAEDMQLPILGESASAPQRLGRRSRFSWSAHLRQALRSVRYAQFFEQVYYLDGDRIRLRKLGLRPMMTLADIVVDDDGGLKAIKQYKPTGTTSMAGTTVISATTTGNRDQTVDIPVDKLVAYVHNQEAGDWSGVNTSIFRPAFPLWLLKERTLRRWAIQLERGSGVPIAEAPEGVEPGSPAFDQLQALTESYALGEASGGAVPNGTKLHLNFPTGAASDPGAFIHMLNQGMAKSVLAGWLELGESREGSRALSYSFIDMFKLSLQGVMKELADVANSHIIADLVELNFGPDEPAPRIVPGAPNLAETLPPGDLAKLVQAGVIVADESTRRSFRHTWNLPEEDGTEPRQPPAQNTPPTEDDDAER